MGRRKRKPGPGWTKRGTSTPSRSRRSPLPPRWRATSKPGYRPCSTATTGSRWQATPRWPRTASAASARSSGPLALSSGGEDLELVLGRLLRPAVAVEDPLQAHPDRGVELAQLLDGVEALAEFNPLVQALQFLAEAERDHRPFHVAVLLVPA